MEWVGRRYLKFHCIEQFIIIMQTIDTTYIIVINIK